MRYTTRAERPKRGLVGRPANPKIAEIVEAILLDNEVMVIIYPLDQVDLGYRSVSSLNAALRNVAARYSLRLAIDSIKTGDGTEIWVSANVDQEPPKKRKRR